MMVALRAAMSGAGISTDERVVHGSERDAGAERIERVRFDLGDGDVVFPFSWRRRPEVHETRQVGEQAMPARAEHEHGARTEPVATRGRVAMNRQAALVTDQGQS